MFSDFCLFCIFCQVEKGASYSQQNDDFLPLYDANQQHQDTLSSDHVTWIKAGDIEFLIIFLFLQCFVYFCKAKEDAPFSLQVHDALSQYNAHR